jgi:hypothetical protein
MQDSATSLAVVEEPIHTLYHSLIHEFPECAGIRDFNPHMTLSHFESAHHAEVARGHIEKWWPTERFLQFDVTEIYLLQRHGDDGQFKRIVRLGLGKSSTIQVETPALPFPDMPSVEEDWVRARAHEAQGKKELWTTKKEECRHISS